MEEAVTNLHRGQLLAYNPVDAGSGLSGFYSKSNILLSVLSDVKLPVRKSQLTSIVILKNNRGKGKRYGR
jgi:hypothetical protein